MFGTQITQRKSRAERVAEDAWDNLVSVVESARDVGRRTSDRAADLAGDAQTKVGTVADEARTRARNALDALAGRTPRRSWGWIALALLGGVAIGWVVAASTPKAVSAAMDRTREEEEDVLTPTPVP
jgi:hypothetical protein